MKETFFISSRSDPEVLHEVKIYPEEKRVSCDCRGFRFHGYCNHIKFFKKAIKKLIQEVNQ